MTRPPPLLLLSAALVLQCLSPTGLEAALSAMPDYSGVVPSTPPFQAATPMDLGGDGRRVLCMTIPMMSGDPTDNTVATGYAWANNLMRQATADIANAIFKTIGTNDGVVDATQVAGFCAAKALWRFSTEAAPITGTDAVTVTIPGASGTTETDKQCMTDANANNCVGLPWGFTTEPQLAAYHDLTSSSLIGSVCWPAVAGRRMLL